MRTTCIWACLLIEAARLSGQSSAISGFLFDPSGRPVNGAVVSCAGHSARSQPDGSFRIDGVDRCEASVLLAGFQNQKIFLTGSDNRIALTVAGVQERVVVSATRGELTPESAGVAASIITGVDLKDRQRPFLADALREVPGVQVIRTGRNGGTTSLYTRGAASTSTLVLLDGMPVNDPGGDLNYGHLLSGGIDRIEVIRGPQSALYGAEASAGVIQLFTPRGNPETRIPKGELSYERGSFQTDRWLAGLNGGLGARIDYSFTGEQWHSVGQYPNDFYRNTTGTANIGYRLTQTTQLRAIYRTYDANVGSPNRVAYGLVDRDAYRTDRDSTASLRLDDARGRSFLQRFLVGYHRLNDGYTDLLSDGPYTVAALVRDVTTPVPRVYLVGLLDPAALPIPPTGTRIIRRTTTLFNSAPFDTITERIDGDYQGTWAQKQGALTFGYRYERQQGDISATGVERINQGLFAHEQIAIGRRLSLAAGARVEHSSVYGSRFAPRAAVSYRLLGATYLRFSAGRGVREPSLLQSFARESTYVGNLALRLEKTNSYEAGLVQEWFGRRVRSELAVFHNSFRDLIVFVTPPGQTVSTWGNVDASRARGIELSTSARLATALQVSGQYTFLHTRINSSSSPLSLATGIGQELPRRPRHSAALTLSLTPRRWSFISTATYLGERQESSDFFGVTRNPAFWNVSAGGSYRLKRNVSPFFRTENLLNSRYQEVLGYASFTRAVRSGVRIEW